MRTSQVVVFCGLVLLALRDSFIVLIVISAVSSSMFAPACNPAPPINPIALSAALSPRCLSNVFPAFTVTKVTADRANASSSVPPLATVVPNVHATSNTSIALAKTPLPNPPWIAPEANATIASIAISFVFTGTPDMNESMYAPATANPAFSTPPTIADAMQKSPLLS